MLILAIFEVGLWKTSRPCNNLSVLLLLIGLDLELKSSPCLYSNTKTPKGKGSIQDDDTLTVIWKPERVENDDAPYILSLKNDYVFKYLDGKEGKGPSGFFKW